MKSHISRILIEKRDLYPMVANVERDADEEIYSKRHYFPTPASKRRLEAVFDSAKDTALHCGKDRLVVGIYV